MSFDWQTEEDNNWDDQAWQDVPETAVSPDWPWRTIIFIVALLSVGGFVIYQQISQRLDDTTSAVEADIFATHNLLSRAAAAQDGELGKAVLSGRDMGWSQTQTSLLQAGLFYEHPTFGLGLADSETAFAPLSREDDRFVSIEIDPELSGAELLYGQDYLAFTGTHFEKITLQQTAVYRRGETRWLLAPPLDTFWGEWQTEEFDAFSVSFPVRDAEIGEELAQDLSQLIADACDTLPEIDCSTAVQLRLDTNPESLLAVADPANLYDGNLRFNLPTPTLVGLPINNSGYQALLHAYASKIIAGLIAQSMAYDCCDHAPMFQALMTYQLNELGLADWPVTHQTHQDLALAGVHTQLLFPYWNSSEFAMIKDADSWQLFGFVDFLLKQHVPQLSAMDVMRDLNRSRAYQSWLIELDETTSEQSFGALDNISRDWWFYTLTQSEVTAVSEQPIPLPAQDLQLGCLGVNSFGDGDTPESKLYRYAINSDSWQEETTIPGLAFFNPLPQDNGVILQIIIESGWQTVWWENGSGLEITNAEEFYSISLGQMDPQGQFLLTYFGNSGEQFATEPSLIDIDSCQNGDCSTTPMAQVPHWSPNGQGMLLTTTELFSEAQYVVDGRIITLSPEAFDEPSDISFRYMSEAPETAVPVGEGIAPFWINDEQFGFIRFDIESAQTPTQELVYASITNPTPATLLTTEDLKDALPPEAGNRLLLMRYALVHPTNEDQLIVMATDNSFEGYLFLVNRQTGDIDLLFSLNISRGEHQLGFSPDGRFLVATGAIQPVASGPNQQNALFGALLLYDFNDGDLQTILVNTDIFLPSFTFDWSRDGSWLAFTRDSGLLGLIAPAHDYQQTISHEFLDCSSLAWINP